MCVYISDIHARDAGPERVMAQQRNLFSFFKKGPETPSKGNSLNASQEDNDGKKQQAVEANGRSPSSRQDEFQPYNHYILQKMILVTCENYDAYRRSFLKEYYTL